MPTYSMLQLRRLVASSLYLTSKTPVDWYRRKQDTAETDEPITMHANIEQTITMHMTLCYLGVLSHAKSYLYYDSVSVIPSTTNVLSGAITLSMIHPSLTHGEMKAVAPSMIQPSLTHGEINPVDNLSKEDYTYTHART